VVLKASMAAESGVKSPLRPLILSRPARPAARCTSKTTSSPSSRMATIALSSTMARWGLDSGAKRNGFKRSGFERPFQARQSRLGAPDRMRPGTPMSLLFLQFLSTFPPSHWTNSASDPKRSRLRRPDWEIRGRRSKWRRRLSVDDARPHQSTRDASAPLAMLVPRLSAQTLLLHPVRNIWNAWNTWNGWNIWNGRNGGTLGKRC
jgi:hypothetical protein